MANIFKAIANAVTQVVTRKPLAVDSITPTINVINKSTQIKDPDLQLMVEACTTQLGSHVAPMWLRGAWKIVVNQPESVGYPIIIMDNPDQAGALGYHTETPDGKIWGRVFTKPVLGGGGSVLHGSLSIACVLSHEIIEAYCDPNVNLWCDMYDGRMVAYEACDPVENDSYEITTKNGTRVSVSNFVLPDWFDAQAPLTSKFDFMAKLSKPLTMSHGGYMVLFDQKTGGVKNVFGSQDAELLHAIRQPSHPASRSTRKKGNKISG
ncbi:MAG: hypothetical protein EBR82_00245 [Caulobacteraceae bacterium]|nr:hypothetical protein [Caulobacteraceae bacterium]